MPITITKTWTCDLCGYSQKEESSMKQKGWVEIAIENPQCERSFTDKLVCPECVKCILNIRHNEKY